MLLQRALPPQKESDSDAAPDTGRSDDEQVLLLQGRCEKEPGHDGGNQQQVARPGEDRAHAGQSRPLQAARQENGGGQQGKKIMRGLQDTPDNQRNENQCRDETLNQHQPETCSPVCPKRRWRLE
jgi:hypothetical protein